MRGCKPWGQLPHIQERVPQLQNRSHGYFRKVLCHTHSGTVDKYVEEEQLSQRYCSTEPSQLGNEWRRQQDLTKPQAVLTTPQPAQPSQHQAALPQLHRIPAAFLASCCWNCLSLIGMAAIRELGLCSPFQAAQHPEHLSWKLDVLWYTYLHSVKVSKFASP